ncbi:MAG: hypothetical protein U9Q74_01795 [Gemmatimonadota bacterium]|nr:hypothetical protein [Gemmatimonadota bacterium]
MRITRHLTTAVILLAATSLLAAPARAQDKKAPDLTGRWQFTVQSEVGTGTPMVTFKQKGDTLTGRYSSQALGERDFTGTFKDGKIEFSFGAESGGQAFTMSFSGKLEGDDAMSGSIDFSGFATGTFTGKRVKQNGD